MPDERDPLPYATPEHQRPARFQMAWGGWALLSAFVLLCALTALLSRFRGPTTLNFDLQGTVQATHKP